MYVDFDWTPLEKAQRTPAGLKKVCVENDEAEDALEVYDKGGVHMLKHYVKRKWPLNKSQAKKLKGKSKDGPAASGGKKKKKKQKIEEAEPDSEEE